jgi:hypothetical protein
MDPAPRTDAPTKTERQLGVGDVLEDLADVRLEAQSEEEADTLHESGGGA